MTPDELVEEREREIGSSDRFMRRRVEDRLDEWFAYLNETGSAKTGKKYARNTLVSAYNAFRSFYKANYVELHVDDALSAWPAKNKPCLTRRDLGRYLLAREGLETSSLLFPYTARNDPAFDESLVEYWQGHSLGNVRGAYFIPPVEEQLRLYKMAEPRLEPEY